MPIRLTLKKADRNSINGQNLITSACFLNKMTRINPRLLTAKVKTVRKRRILQKVFERDKTQRTADRPDRTAESFRGKHKIAAVLTDDTENPRAFQFIYIILYIILAAQRGGDPQFMFFHYAEHGMPHSQRSLFSRQRNSLSPSCR